MFLSSAWNNLSAVNLSLDPDLGGDPGGSSASPSPAPSSEPASSMTQPTAPAPSGGAPSAPSSGGLRGAMSAALGGEASSAGTSHQRMGASSTPPADASAGSVPTAAQQQAQMQAIRDYLASQGEDVSNWTSDADWIRQSMEARRYLQQRAHELRQYEQLRPYIPTLQQLYQQQVQAQMQAREQQQQADQGPKRWHPGFKADPAFQYIERTEDGQLRVRDGAIVPPGVMERYQQYQMERQEWAKKLLEDPAAAFEPFENHLMEKVVEKVQEALIRPREEQALASQIVAQNQAWLLQWDENGQPVRGANGMPRLSPAGMRYQQIVNQLEQEFGTRDPAVLHRYATSILQGELAAMAASQQQAPSPGAAANGVTAQPPASAPLAQPSGVEEVNQQRKKNFLNQAMRQSAAAGSLAGNGAAASRELEGRNLRERMRQNYQLANGTFNNG